MNARTPLAALLGAVAADLAIDRSAWGRAAPAAAPAPTEPRETWTPGLVMQTMIDAQLWARRTGRPVGPAGYTRSRSDYQASDLDFEREGWGLPEVADPETTFPRCASRPRPPWSASMRPRSNGLRTIFARSTSAPPGCSACSPCARP